MFNADPIGGSIVVAIGVGLIWLLASGGNFESAWIAGLVAGVIAFAIWASNVKD